MFVLIRVKSKKARFVQQLDMDKGQPPRRQFETNGRKGKKGKVFSRTGRSRHQLNAIQSPT
jgi:hypothetical protein